MLRIVLVLAAGILALGAMACAAWWLEHRRPTPAAPEPRIVVTTVFHGGSPYEVEQQVIVPIENALSRVKNAARLESTARRDVGIISIVLPADTGEAALSEATDAARAAILDASRSLPPAVDPPTVQRFHSQGRPVRVVELSNSLPPEAQSAAARMIDNAVTSANVSVRVAGNPSDEVVIRLDSTRLRALGLTAPEVARAVEESAVSLALPGAGSVGARVEPVADVESLGKVMVRDGTPAVELRDVATISEEHRWESRSGSRFGPAPLVELLSSAPLETASAELDRALATVSAQLPPKSMGTVWQATAAATDVPTEVTIHLAFPLGISDEVRRHTFDETLRMLTASGEGVAWWIDDRDDPRVTLSRGTHTDGDTWSQALARNLPPGAAIRSLDLVCADELCDPQALWTVLLQGPDLEQLERVTREVRSALQSDPAVLRADPELAQQAPSISVELDRDRAADLGVAASDVSTAVAIVTGADHVGSLPGSGDGPPRPIRLTSSEEPHGPTFDPALLYVPSRKVGRVPLSDVARVSMRTELDVIYRVNRQRAAIVHVRLRRGATARDEKRLQTAVAGVALPAGLSVSWRKGE